MDPDMKNCMILRIHMENEIINLRHAIWRRTSVSARYGSKKNCLDLHFANLDSNPTSTGYVN